ncbi:MAG TPA: metallophosphoesterase family protein [Phenylobacterium sp.]|nr:metallophosphoesterase family protein [Phenylobacterium sp.]
MTDPRVRTTSPSTGGRLVYAVGDVHGYAHQLRALLAEIRADAARSRTAERPRLIFLGDYVDRGPDSLGAIEAILAAEAEPAFEVTALKGNHEDAMLRFLAEPGFAPAWISNWGDATLRSYGVEPPRTDDPEACEAARARLAAALPDSHRAFLSRLTLTAREGDYLFVHAGLRPGVALADQAEHDLLWIRYEFLESEADFGCVVVHGHTLSERPEVRENRINVDTGVYFTGVLTAVRLEDGRREFLQSTA